jgi:hypothetical protein
MDKFLGFKTEEILTCLLLVVVGYAIAKMFSGCGCSNNGFSVGIQDKYPGGSCIPGERECSPTNTDKDYKYNCPPSGVCESVTRRCGPLLDNCQDTATSTCEHDGHLCENDCIAPEGGINGIWDGTNSVGRKGGWCKVPAPPPPPAPPTPPPPPPVNESCTYIGDNNYPTNPRSFKDYMNEEKLDELECPDVQIKIDECKDAWRNYYTDKGVQYDGSFCMQTLPDETMANELKGRGHCPLMHDADGKPYPANWITNGQSFSIDEAKNRCKLSYLDGNPVGTIDEQENAPGRYAWVSETNKNDCDCPGSPTPKPKIICKDKNLMDGTSNPGKKKGDCPTQTPDQTCCYDTTTQDTDFYQHYKEETKNMIQKCENDPHGSFTGPKSNQDVINLGFPRLTGKNKENELFCYYNDNQKHPGKHRDYCDSNSEYENGHGYFCSFSSNKKHNRNKHNIRDLKHKRNALRDQLSQLETQV